MATERSVLTSSFPRAGTTYSYALRTNARERERERDRVTRQSSLVRPHPSSSTRRIEFVDGRRIFQKFKRQTGPRLKRSMTIDHRSTTDRPPTVRERIASFAYLDKSYPAAPSDPRDGIVACSDIFFTRSGASSSPLNPIVVIRLAVVVVVVVRIDGRRRNARAIERLVVTARDGIVSSSTCDARPSASM